VKFFLWILFPAAALAQTPVPAPPKPPETFQSAMEKQRASIALQRETVRKQMEMAVRRQEASSEDEAPAADCPSIADLELIPLIESAAKQHQVEPKLIRSVIEQESAFHACAISSKATRPRAARPYGRGTK
jgi:soluble lytic murein transglycosylase-like protein